MFLETVRTWRQQLNLQDYLQYHENHFWLQADFQQRNLNLFILFPSKYEDSEDYPSPFMHLLFENQLESKPPPPSRSRASHRGHETQNNSTGMGTRLWKHWVQICIVSENKSNTSNNINPLE